MGAGVTVTAGVEGEFVPLVPSEAIGVASASANASRIGHPANMTIAFARRARTIVI
jgi:hypothetical protein